MGRGRAKAKQTKVARELKYRSVSTDFSSLERELRRPSDEIPDRQGRVTVPAPLRDYAGLTKECVVIGALARLEIWDAATWNTYLGSQEQSFAERSEEVLPGLL